MATYGGGIYNEKLSSPILRNTIIWENSSGVYNSNWAGTCSPVYNYCLVQNLNPEGTGNLDGILTYPNMFVNAIYYSQAPTTEGDYSLAAGSLCIDAGNNNFNNTASDLAGNLRIYNGRIDMGAYEYGSTSPSIKNIDINAINIYPNPAQHTLYIQSSETIEQVNIYDISGRMLLTREFISLPNQGIDVSNLAKGIYLVKVRTATGETLKRIVVSD